MKILSKITLLFLAGIMATAFKGNPGGEGFEIYLNNRLVVQQWGDKINQVSSLKIDRSSEDNRLTLKYYHCGKIGKDRVVLIKDEQGKTLKTFRYPDTTPISAMEIPLKEVIKLKEVATLKIFYSSSQLPNGRTVLEIKPGSSALASN